MVVFKTLFRILQHPQKRGATAALSPFDSLDHSAGISIFIFFFPLLDVAIGSEFVTFGPAKSHNISPAWYSAGRMWNGLTIIAPVAQYPYGEKKGETRYLFPFLLFFLFIYFFLHAGDENPQETL